MNNKYRGIVTDDLNSLPTKHTRWYDTYLDAHQAAEKLCKRTHGDRGSIDVETENKEESHMFIKVTGEDGVFYDRTSAVNAKRHIAMLVDGGYEAEIIPDTEVPPCIYRNFAGGLNSYNEASFNGGGDFYHK